MRSSRVGSTLALCLATVSAIATPSAQAALPDRIPTPHATRAPSPKPPFRAFPSTSYWNTKLPADAPIDPNSEAYLDVLRSYSFQYPRFAGISQAGTWGIPIYVAKKSDPVYNVTTLGTCPWPVPAAFASLRIPHGAKPDASADSELTVYDSGHGVVAGLWQATYDPIADTWQACAGSAYYLASNGLHGVWPTSTDPRNTGHRGLPPPVHVVRWDEIQAGVIRHVLEMVVSSTCGAAFPMIWGEGCGQPLLEGTRIRLKGNVDLVARGLTGAPLIVATALQTYGAVIGDCNGSNAATIKVENTVQEGRGWLWNGVLGYDSLDALTWDDFEIIQIGWGQ